MAERVDYFDVLRGLAIIGVVAIHSSNMGVQIRNESLDFYLTIVWRNFWNFSVPLFLSISGYFLTRKSFKVRNDYLNFISKQIPRVYLPLLFWSFLGLLLAVVYNNSVFSELIKLLTFQSFGPYYFIALIIQYYLLLPVLQRFSNVKGLVACVIVSLTATSIIFYTRYFGGIDLPLIIYAGNFCTWVMFFVFGLYLGAGNFVKLSNTLLITATVCFFLLSCLESWILIDLFDRPKYAVTAIKITSFLYAFSLIAFLFKNKDIIQSDILRKLGNLSFGIYLIHMLALNFESRILHKLLPGLPGSSLLHQLMLTFLVLSTCAVGILLTNKIISERMSLYIGFK